MKCRQRVVWVAVFATSAICAVVIAIWLRAALDAEEVVVRNAFSAIKSKSIDAFLSELSEVETIFLALGAGFRSVFTVSKAPNRSLATHLLTSVTHPALEVMAWMEYVKSEERLNEIFQDYGYGSREERSPVTWLPNGTFVPGSGLNVPLTVGYSNLPMDTPQAAIDSDFRLFIDVSQREERFSVMEASYDLLRPVATSPIRALSGFSGFFIFFTLRGLNESTLQWSDTRLGVLGAGVYENRIRTVLTEAIESQVEGPSTVVEWVINDVASGEPVFTAAALPAHQEKSSAWEKHELPLLGRKYEFQARYHDGLQDLTEGAWDVGELAAALVCASLAVIVGVGIIAHCARRNVALNACVYEAELKAAKTELEAGNLLLRYANHEIRNPLNVLTGSLELLEYSIKQSKDANEEEKESQGRGVEEGALRIKVRNQEAETEVHIAAMKAAAKKLKRRIDELLEYQRLKHASFKITNKPTDVLAVLRRIIDDHRPLSRVPLEFLPQGPTGTALSAWPLLLIDDDRLSQIVANAVSNAIKVTMTGSIKITAHLESKERQGVVSAANLRIEVLDSGPGLKGRDPAMLFESFATFAAQDADEEAPPATPVPPSPSSLSKRKSRPSPPPLASSGLGLPICKLLAEFMKGSVELRDTGHGCCFTLSFPVEIISQSTNELRSPEGASAAAAITRPKSNFTPHGRALVVDDSPINVKILCKMLLTLGIEPVGVFAKPGNFEAEVRKHLRRSNQLLGGDGLSDEDVKPFKFIFIDINLGTENGASMVASLKPDLTQPKPLFIAVSGSTVAGEEQPGFATSLLKPVQLDELKSVLKHLRSSTPQHFGEDSV